MDTGGVRPNTTHTGELNSPDWLTATETENRAAADAATQAMTSPTTRVKTKLPHPTTKAMS